MGTALFTRWLKFGLQRIERFVQQFHDGPPAFLDEAPETRRAILSSLPADDALARWMRRFNRARLEGSHG